MSRSLVQSFDSSNIQIYTAPNDAPKEINNDIDAALSAEVVLLDFSKNPEYLQYDCYLIACFSDHPLITKLKFLLDPSCNILGIFQASIYVALATQTNSKSIILTSGKEWEHLLDAAILKFFNTTSWPNSFEHTKAIGLNPLQLDDPSNYKTLHKMVNSLMVSGISTIILGCAGLSSQLNNFKLDFPQLEFIDGVQSGIKLLSSI